MLMIRDCATRLPPADLGMVSEGNCCAAARLASEIT